MNKELLVPDIGDFDQVEIIEVLVKEGNKIKINDPIVTLESDKSSVEVPSTLDGEVESIKVKVGDKVSKGDILITVKSLTFNEPPTCWKSFTPFPSKSSGVVYPSTPLVTLPFAGFIVSKYFLENGFTKSPPMNKSYFFFNFICVVLSGAAA